MDSAKNGRLEIHERFGVREIHTGTFYQSGPYIKKMWQKVLKSLPSDFGVHKILVLGLGAGDVVRLLRVKYPQAEITAVDFDVEMKKIAEGAGLGNLPHPRIIIDDALSACEKLLQQGEKFDLVVVDLFLREKLASVVFEGNFVSALQKILDRQGLVLFNCNEDFLKVQSVWEKCLSFWGKIPFHKNVVTVWRSFGLGQIGDPFPKDYIDRKQSPEYLAKIHGVTQKMICRGGLYGVATQNKYFSIEKYFTDRSPDVEAENYLRVIIWQPFTLTIPPKGWWKNWLWMRELNSGVVDLESPRDFTSMWSDHAKRQLAKWHKQSEFEIVEMSLEEFTLAYKESKALDVVTRHDFIKVMEFQKKHGMHIYFYGARNKSSGVVVSGLAVTDYPSLALSTHTIAFTHKKEKNSFAGTALIHHWYTESQKRNLRFLNFGVIWKKGDPKAWIGYSKFKKQFSPYILAFPVPFIKIVWPKKQP